MSWGHGGLALDLLWIVLWGVLLTFLYQGAFRAVELLPLGDDRRGAIARSKPLAGLFVALIYCLFTAQTLFAQFGNIQPIALLLVVTAFFVGSRNLVSDVFSGIALRAERSCQVGDHVRIGSIQGKITAMGTRAISLETQEGENALIPYAEATKIPIVRIQAVEGGASHSFDHQVSEKLSFAKLVQVVERAALAQHWGSIARPPEINRGSEGLIKITVFSLSSAHVAEVELAVKKALTKAEAS